MPDKTTPQIEEAAKSGYEEFCRGQPWDEATEGWKTAMRETARVILSTILEPSEEEIEEAATAIRDFEQRHRRNPADIMVDDIHRHKARAALIAAARVRVGQK